MSVTILTQESFDQAIEQNEIVFIDFWAQWCGPCLSFAPIFTEVANANPDILFAKINISEESQLASDFNIRSIPNLMVFKKGVIIFSQAGLLPKEALVDLVEQARKAELK
ncbi:MAG: thioredoxin [Gammaproteobacteria bacterium]